MRRLLMLVVAVIMLMAVGADARPPPGRPPGPPPLHCDPGFADCDGSRSNGCETALNTVTDCGECGTSCSVANGTPSCTGAPGTEVCGIASCNAGFDDCDAQTANGCETDVTTTTDCGACANACPAVANASSTCVSGVCDIASCFSGFDDCNGVLADGCEADLNSVATCGSCTIACNDGNSCTFDRCANQLCAAVDLRRCADVDLVCGGLELAGCSNPDSDGDGLSDVWEDAQMIDLNCDGAYDSNDVELPFANRDVKDVYLKISWMAHSPFTYAYVDTNVCPAQTVFAFEPRDHKPDAESVNAVVAAFSGAHVQQEFLRCTADVDCASLQNHSCVDFVCLPSCSTDLDCAAVGGSHCVLKDDLAGRVCRKWRLHAEVASVGTPHYDIVHFGSVADGYTDECTGVSADRHANFFDVKATEFDAKDAIFKHWGIFAHKSTCSTVTGCNQCPAQSETGTLPVPNMTGLAEFLGNDFMVSLAASNLFFLISGQRRIEIESGALMHELGHNLGLFHGGPQGSDLDDKPNHLSVMHPLYQFTNIPYSSGSETFSDIPCAGCSRPDYSHAALAPLSEASLVEAAGVGGEVLPPAHQYDLVRYYTTVGCGTTCSGTPITNCPRTGPNSGPIDWDGNGTIDPGTISADLNGNGFADETFVGADDWSFLRFDFQCSPSYIDTARPSSLSPGAIAEPDIELLMETGLISPQ